MLFCFKKPDGEIDPGSIKMGDVIGQGTFGTVRKGEWCGTEVAIKCITLPPEWQNDSWSEIKEILIWRYATM